MRKLGLTKIPSERPDHQRPSPVAAPFRRGGGCGRSPRGGDHFLQCISRRVGTGISPALERLARTSKSAKAHELRSLLGGRLQEIRTMTVYVIADVRVTDDRWVPAYAASVHDVVHKHGGKYLARSGNVKTLEGQPLDTTLI